MTDNDGITSDARAREEEYFRRKDRELVESLRRAAEADASRQALERTSGIHDPVMLQELEALGFTPDTASLLPLVPIVQVAWAEGGVSDDERKLIVQFARGRNIPEGSAADETCSPARPDSSGRCSIIRKGRPDRGASTNSFTTVKRSPKRPGGSSGSTGSRARRRPCSGGYSRR
jgi:hypothetical protein